MEMEKGGHLTLARHIGHMISLVGLDFYIYIGLYRLRHEGYHSGSKIRTMRPTAWHRQTINIHKDETEYKQGVNVQNKKFKTGQKQKRYQQVSKGMTERGIYPRGIHNTG